MSDHTNSFSIDEKTYKYFDLKTLDTDKVDRLPFTHKILLENALRYSEDDNDCLLYTSPSPRDQA